MKTIALVSLALLLALGGLWLALPIERVIASRAFLVESTPVDRQTGGEAAWALLVAQLVEDSDRPWEMSRTPDTVTLRSVVEEVLSRSEIRLLIQERFVDPPSSYQVESCCTIRHRLGLFDPDAAASLAADHALAAERLRGFLELLAGHTPPAAVPSPD